MKFSEKVGNRLTNKWLNFGGDLDPNRDTGKTCLGGGMHCPSASSFLTLSASEWKDTLFGFDSSYFPHRIKCS